MATATLLRTKIGPLNGYFSLAKPGGIVPHLITASAAMFLARGGPPPLKILAFTLLGGGLIAAAANTFNSYLDRDVDARMARTMHRPIPSGRITPGHALVFGLAIGTAGIALLGIFTAGVAAELALLALLYYVLPYTILLKRRTYLSSIVGSGIGALPPLIGWFAAGGHLSPIPLLLSTLIILWTIPHFWTLAVFRRKEYEKAGINVLPEKGVKVWVSACSVAAIGVSLILKIIAGLGWIYFCAAVLLGIGLVYWVVKFNQKENTASAKRFYVYSIFYIGVIFGAIILDCMVL